MTPLDALLDRGDDSARARLLDNLAAGIPLPRALAAALGIRSPTKGEPSRPGGAWALAWRALAEARRVDLELDAACKEAERKSDDRGEQGKEAAPDEDRSRGTRADAERRDPREPTADSRGDDGRLVRPSYGGDVHDRAPEDAAARGGDPDRRLGPGGRGRETGEEAEACGDHEGVGQVSAAEPDSQGGAGSDGATAIATRLSSPRLSFAARVAARGLATAANDDNAPDSGPSITEPATGWDRARLEALAMGSPADPKLYRYLLWVEARCVAAGMHALDPAWKRHFWGFYDSGKFVDVGRFGVRAAKSDSTMYALTGEVVLNQRTLQPNIVGRCPVMSANMGEAGGRFDTAKEILRAIGFSELPKGSKADPGAREFKASGGGSTALTIELQDSQEHNVQFRVMPASEAGAAGFTGIAGFGDELDLWGKQDGANPASKVLRVLRSRYTTQPEAKLHLMSATYDRKSEHAALIEKGDTPGQYVARIGKEGSAYDYLQRMRLARVIDSKDAILIAPALDPMCADIPCWVTNPITPIEEAYAKADGDLIEMFALYGGRLALAGGSGRMTLEDAQYMARANVALQKPYDPRHRSDDGLFDYTGIPGADDTGPTRRRGL